MSAASDCPAGRWIHRCSQPTACRVSVQSGTSRASGDCLGEVGDVGEPAAAQSFVGEFLEASLDQPAWGVGVKGLRVGRVTACESGQVPDDVGDDAGVAGDFGVPASGFGVLAQIGDVSARIMSFASLIV